jgi:hypothetical protein
MEVYEKARDKVRKDEMDEEKGAERLYEKMVDD